MHIDFKGKDFKGPTQELDDRTLAAEDICPINFTQSGKRFALCLHYNGSKSFLFVNATKTCKFKVKNTEVKDYALCLSIIVSKDFTIDNMIKTRLKGAVNVFLLI